MRRSSGILFNSRSRREDESIDHYESALRTLAKSFITSITVFVRGQYESLQSVLQQR